MKFFLNIFCTAKIIELYPIFYKSFILSGGTQMCFIVVIEYFSMPFSFLHHHDKHTHLGPILVFFSKLHNIIR